MLRLVAALLFDLIKKLRQVAALQDAPRILASKLRVESCLAGHAGNEVADRVWDKAKGQICFIDLFIV